MIRVRKALQSDFPSWAKCLRRSMEAMTIDGDSPWKNDPPSEKDFLVDFENGQLFVIADGNQIIGSLSTSHNVSEAFFPKSKSQRKTNDLLDLIGHQGHPLTIIHRFFIDPMYQRKGLGKLLFHDIEARYKENDFLLALDEENAGVLPFFLALGFRNHGLIEIEKGESMPQYLLSKMYIEPGLCRNIYW